MLRASKEPITNLYFYVVFSHWLVNPYPPYTAQKIFV